MIIRAQIRSNPDLISALSMSGFEIGFEEVLLMHWHSSEEKAFFKERNVNPTLLHVGDYDVGIDCVGYYNAAFKVEGATQADLTLFRLTFKEVRQEDYGFPYEFGRMMHFDALNRLNYMGKLD